MKTPLTPIRAAILAFAVAVTAAGSPAPAQTPFEPAAVVNDEAITRFELDQRLRAQSALTGAEINTSVAGAVLNVMIADRLRLQAARKSGIRIAEAEIDEAMNTFATRRGVTLDALRARLRTVGASPETIRDVVETELAWRELIRRRYGARTKASEADVERELALLDADGVINDSSSSERRYEIGFLVIAISGDATAEEVIDATKQLSDVRNDIKTCEALAARAEDFGPGSGVRSNVLLKDVPPPLDQQIPNLVPGQFTDPVRLVNVVSMAMLCSTQDAGGEDQRVEEIRRELVQSNFQRYADAYLQELRRDAIIEIR
jgi:peptidyl-prolyl cis-trans isomerase SurA